MKFVSYKNLVQSVDFQFDNYEEKVFISAIDLITKLTKILLATVQGTDMYLMTLDRSLNKLNIVNIFVFLINLLLNKLPLMLYNFYFIINENTANHYPTKEMLQTHHRRLILGCIANLCVEFICNEQFDVSYFDKYLVRYEMYFYEIMFFVYVSDTEMTTASGQLPLPRWLLEKCFEFYDYDCFCLELLLLIGKIRRVSECCIYEH